MFIPATAVPRTLCHGLPVAHLCAAVGRKVMETLSYSLDISVAGGNGQMLMKLWLVCILKPIQKRLPGRWQLPCCQWLGHTLVCQLRANPSILIEPTHAHPPFSSEWGPLRCQRQEEKPYPGGRSTQLCVWNSDSALL